MPLPLTCFTSAVQGPLFSKHLAYDCSNLSLFRTSEISKSSLAASYVSWASTPRAKQRVSRTTFMIDTKQVNLRQRLRLEWLPHRYILYLYELAKRFISQNRPQYDKYVNTNYAWAYYYHDNYRFNEDCFAAYFNDQTSKYLMETFYDVHDSSTSFRDLLRKTLECCGKSLLSYFKPYANIN